MGLEIALSEKFKEPIVRSEVGSPLGLKLGAIVGETMLGAIVGETILGARGEQIHRTNK